ncbi:MAG: DUF4153 domain-containing protein, partial [Candidatus Uhrbacteria bacterium]|nr:DUF4153 domain-containing protein [Candidatus Uhrbacteria bacterium]
MKFPSFRGAGGSIIAVVRRFPFTIFSSVAAAIIQIFLIHATTPPGNLWQIISVLYVAIPAFLAVTLLGEAKAFTGRIIWTVQALVAVLLVLYGYFLVKPLGETWFSFSLLQILLIVAGVLACTFVPFVFQWTKMGIQRFWQYNRILVQAAIVTFIWSSVLQAGLTIALLSIIFLFGLEIRPDDWLQYTFVLISGIFSPLFFLSRVPKNPHELSVDQSYPREVRLFAQFLLAPLVTLYFFILYAYTAKILIGFEWPEGSLAWMIIGFSFVGVLAYLTLYPLRETRPWVKYFGAGLFMAMIPQIGMLFWAISFRLRDYGVTENRYFVLVFGAWLLVCAIYYLVSRAKDIRFIPMSLCLLALLSSFGPWSTFAVSEWSQVGRLEKILVRNGVLQDGTYVSGRTNLPPDDEDEILEIMEYLGLNHDFDKIEPWFGGEDLDAIESNAWEKGDRIVQEKFGLDVYGLDTDREYFFLDLSSPAISLGTEGYDQFANWSTDRSFLLDGESSKFFIDAR